MPSADALASSKDGLLLCGTLHQLVRCRRYNLQGRSWYYDADCIRNDIRWHHSHQGTRTLVAARDWPATTIPSGRMETSLKMKGGQRCEPQPDPEEASLHTLTGLSQANVEAGHENYSPTSIPRTRSCQSNASVASNNEGQTVAETNDTSTAILPSSYYTEHEENARYTDNVVAEPEEIDYPQPSTSTTPHPKIVARSATNEPFRHAPVAAKWTLQDGQNIEERKD